MDIKKALEIINALADGIDPVTGEIYSGNSPYQKPDVIRALFIAKESIEKDIERKRKKGTEPERTGEPWTKEEEKEVCDDFDNGMELKEIAKKQKRTIGGIRSRLVKAGKLEEEPFRGNR